MFLQLSFYAGGKFILNQLSNFSYQLGNLAHKTGWLDPYVHPLNSIWQVRNNDSPRGELSKLITEATFGRYHTSKLYRKYKQKITWICDR